VNASDLAAAIESRPPLDVSADLTVVVDGADIRVESYTDRITVAAPSLSAAVAVLRGLTGPDDGLGGALDRTTGLGRLLAAADLTVLVRVRGREIARLGADLAGVRYRDCSVRPAGLLAALV
jgi:hypothetical protein